MQSTNEGMDVDKKSEAKFLSNCAARLMAAEVFKLPGSAAYQERERTNEIASKEGAKKNNFVRKIGAHIKNKAARERESAQRANLAKVGEPLESDVVRINNNISLEVSNHTSRHTRYADDSSTDSDFENERSFCDDFGLDVTPEVDELENSQALTSH